MLLRMPQRDVTCQKSLRVAASKRLSTSLPPPIGLIGPGNCTSPLWLSKVVSEEVISTDYAALSVQVYVGK